MDSWNRQPRTAKVTSANSIRTGKCRPDRCADIDEGEDRKGYVTDVKTAQELLEEEQDDISSGVKDVPQESVFLTTVFP